MKIEKKPFGQYKDREVIEYSLDNGNDLEIKILNLGGTIREINYKGKNRVLGFDNIEGYINGSGYLGALVGRVAGRISNGKIKINNKVYQLDQNEGTNCIHGGKDGFTFQIWDLEEKIVNEDSISIVLKYISKDMECGFPGELTVIAKYTLSKDNSLTIEYFGETTEDTIITLTNHSYFNLNDNLSISILDHVLKIEADNYIKLDENNIPVKISKVDNTPFDFRKSKEIKRDMDLNHKDLKSPEGYDHPFILNKDNKEEITLYSKDSGVLLNIETTEPVVVLYCSNKLDENIPLTHGHKSFKYQGVCLETQWYPDAINQDFLPNNILKSNEKYYSKTKYTFKSNLV